MASLRHFTQEEIIITGEEAKIIYKFFFDKNQTVINIANSDEILRPIEIEFAQALLVEALDRTYDMGYVAALFHSLTDKKKALASGGKILKKFGKKAFKHWFKHATEDDLWDDPKIYETVRLEVMRRFETQMAKLLVNDIDWGYKE